MTDREVKISNLGEVFVVRDNGNDKAVDLYATKDIYPAYFRVKSEYHKEDDYSEEAVDRIKKFLASYRLGKDVYVSSMTVEEDEKIKSYDFGYDSFETSLGKFDSEEKIYEIIDKLYDISFRGVPQYLGEFDFGEYDTDFDGQQEMIVDAMHFAETAAGNQMRLLDVLDSDYDDPECTGYFKNEWDGDYHLFYGDSLVTNESCEFTEYVDGRVYNATESVLDDFWQLGGVDCMIDEIKSIDTEERLAIYARKGKDWYVGFSVIMEEVYISWVYDDDGEREIEEDPIYIYYIIEDKKAQEKAVEILIDTKNSLDVAGETERYAFDAENGAPLALRKMFEDSYELERAIADNIESYTIDAEDAVRDAVEKLIYDNTDESLVIFGRYKHLQIIKKLAEEDGCSLVRTPVLGTLSAERFAVKCEDEEYHFELAELLSSSPKDFYDTIKKKLENRAKQKKEESALMRRASHVFVGIDDSVESGNCMPGTLEFTRKHGIDRSRIGGVRGDVLLAMENSSFVKRAVIHAIKRQSAKHQLL